MFSEMTKMEKKGGQTSSRWKSWGLQTWLGGSPFSQKISPYCVVQHTEGLYQDILKSNNSHDNWENERFTFLQLDHM